MGAPKVYLAGPEVFFPDAEAQGEALKKACATRGLEGLFPLNGAASTSADQIFATNLEKIVDCDAVVANITPFRGPHMDPGTAWEIGYAASAGKPVFAWTTSPQLLHERIWSEKGLDGRWRDALGNEVEHFDMAENLMIGCSVKGVWQSPENALDALAKTLLPETVRL